MSYLLCLIVLLLYHIFWNCQEGERIILTYNRLENNGHTKCALVLFDSQLCLDFFDSTRADDMEQRAVRQPHSVAKEASAGGIAVQRIIAQLHVQNRVNGKDIPRHKVCEVVGAIPVNFHWCYLSFLIIPNYSMEFRDCQVYFLTF